MNNQSQILTIFAGTNGAGKSTISKQMREFVGKVIDPDAIAKEMNPLNPRDVDLAAGKEIEASDCHCRIRAIPFKD